MKFLNIFRKMSVYVILAAGLLALAEIINQADVREVTLKKPEFRKVSPFTRLYRAAVAVTRSRQDNLKDQLRSAMAQDELAGVNPFSNLSPDDALRRLFQSDIERYERQALRSPSYQEESGYDSVHYAIHNKNGSTSTILAFVETGRVVLMILTPKTEMYEYALFHDGALEEVSELGAEAAQALLAQHLDSSIPFLSLNR